MVTRFALTWISPSALRSASRALIATSALFALLFIKSVFVCVLFIIIAYWLFSLCPLERKKMWWSFIALIFSVVSGAFLLPSISTLGFLTSFLLFILSFSLFFLFFGVLERVWSDEARAYSFLNTLLLFILFFALISLMYFSWSAPLIPLALGLGAFLLTREATFIFNIPHRLRALAVSLCVGCAVAEMAFATTFIPFSQIIFSAFLALFTLFLRDVSVVHFKGVLSLRFVAREVFFFVFLTLFFFVITHWHL